MSFKSTATLTAREIERIEIQVRRDIDKAIFYEQGHELVGLRAIQLKLRELQLSIKAIRREHEEMEHHTEV